MARAPAHIRRAEPLRNDAFQPHAAEVAEHGLALRLDRFAHTYVPRSVYEISSRYQNLYSSRIGPLAFFAFLTGLAVGKLDSGAGVAYWIILVLGIAGVAFMFFLLMKRSA